MDILQGRHSTGAVPRSNLFCRCAHVARVCEKMLAHWFFVCYSLFFKGLEDKEHMDGWSD